MMTSVEVLDDFQVKIERDGVVYQFSPSVIAVAASALREAMLKSTPMEVPARRHWPMGAKPPAGIKHCATCGTHWDSILFPCCPRCP